MTTILEIEKAVKELPPEEFSRFRLWLEDYELERDSLASSAMVAQMLDEEEGDEDQFLA